jgi:glycogen(starch) synthase
MRVLHLTPEFPPVIWGGLGTAVGGLVTASAKSGVTTGVLLVGGVLVVGDGGYGGGWHPGWPTEEEPEPGSKIDLRGIRFFQVSPHEAVSAGLRFARRWRPDVIHLHSAWLWPAAHAIREQTGVPIVFTVHSLDRAEYEIGQFITHWDLQDVVIRSADRLISLSRSEKELLLRYCPEVASRIRIVGNGIDDVPPPRRRPMDEPPVILYSGRFVDRKGIRELLAIIPTVLEAAPETRFVLVGGYGGGAEIERCWMDEVLRPWRHRIHFTGWLTPARVAAWYRAADILLVPSWYEPFGMVVLEGMLHGVAIVACDVGGPAEILEHGRTALLVPPRNAGALAAAVLRLGEDPSLRRGLAAAAAAEVRRTWLWPRIVEKMRTVYAEALDDSLQRRFAPPAAA